MPSRTPHHILSAASILAMVTGLSACAAGPDYVQPEISTPARYMGAPTSVSPQTADLTLWWESFNDPLLTHYVTQALAQNLDLAQAIARVSQARSQLGLAKAALLPSGQISAQGTAVHQSLETPLGRIANAQPGFDRDAALYEANVGASWEVDLMGGLSRQREAARAEYEATQASASAARLTIAAQTADSYISIRGLQARLAVAKAQTETQTQLLKMVQLQYKAGVAAEMQLRQAEGALAQTEATIPELSAALDQAMNGLDVLLGDIPGTHRAELAINQPVPLAPTIIDTGTPAELLRRRPDVIMAERRLAASNARIGAAISEYYPKFSLSGLLGSATTTAGNMFTNPANQLQGVIGLRWRLFDFARIDSEVSAAKGRNAEMLAAYRLQILRATQDVEDALSALANRNRQQAILATGEASLSRARISSLAAYKGGIISLTDMLDTDSRLLATQDSLVRAKVGTAQAAIASFRALGGGWNNKN